MQYLKLPGGVLFSFILFMLPGLAQQPATPQTGSVKVGFVESTRVLYETNEGKAGIEKLNQYMTDRQAQFEKQGAELKTIQEEYTNKKLTLNADTRTEMERSIEQRQRELQRFQEDAQAEVNRRQGELLERISDKVQVIIREYAQQRNYSVIFIRDNSQAYVDPSLDVTLDIIRIYNERHPTASAPPPSNP